MDTRWQVCQGRDVVRCRQVCSLTAQKFGYFLMVSILAHVRYAKAKVRDFGLNHHMKGDFCMYGLQLGCRQVGGLAASITEPVSKEQSAPCMLSTIRSLEDMFIHSFIHSVIRHYNCMF